MLLQGLGFYNGNEAKQVYQGLQQGLELQWCNPLVRAPIECDSIVLLGRGFNKSLKIMQINNGMHHALLVSGIY
ncbi:hypothetical protein ACH50O_01825 [Methylomonas sp. 2BW1-5-20]|uniref:hypothetical protein n=1 Tax=Methylomonas sp. 2BW1-5-20 TaxID=3376686 RepID=UPI004050E12B